MNVLKSILLCLIVSAVSLEAFGFDDTLEENQSIRYEQSKIISFEGRCLGTGQLRTVVVLKRADGQVAELNLTNTNRNRQGGLLAGADEKVLVAKFTEQGKLNYDNQLKNCQQSSKSWHFTLAVSTPKDLSFRFGTSTESGSYDHPVNCEIALSPIGFFPNCTGGTTEGMESVHHWLITANGKKTEMKFYTRL